MNALGVNEDVVRSATPWSNSVIALGVVEARRMLLHPAYLVLAGYCTVVIGVDLTRSLSIERRAAGEFIGILLVFFLALTSMFPASLTATSARRAGAEEMFDAVPVDRRTRTWAMLAAGLGPASIASIGALAVWLLRRGQPPTEEPVLTAGALCSVPLLYLGTAALACAAARWLPVPGVPLAIVFGLVGWVARTNDSQSAALVLTAPWIVSPAPENLRYVAGYSEAGHFVYLLGLVALAATAALWRDDLRRMFAVGIPVGLLTVLAAWAQLP